MTSHATDTRRGTLRPENGDGASTARQTGEFQGDARRAFFLLYALFGATHTLRSDTRHELATNRTQLIRDAALASGKTCIACGQRAANKVGTYPVCALHRETVRARDANWKWKKNVRTRHARRILSRRCAWCGRRRNLNRHHEWTRGSWGHPPRPVVLCRRCHRIADCGSMRKVWWWRFRLLARHLLRLCIQPMARAHAPGLGGFSVLKQDHQYKQSDKRGEPLGNRVEQ